MSQRILKGSKIVSHRNSTDATSNENKVGINETRVAKFYIVVLIIAEPPVITSVVVNYPQITGSPRNYMVPASFRDGVVTCNAFGLPPPTAEWLVPAMSNATTSLVRQSVFISTTLQFSNGFLLNDIGTYNCIIQNSTVSESVALSQAANPEPATVRAPTPCQVSTANVTFQLRVLTTDCLSWDDNLREQIGSDFQDVLTGGIVSQCQTCVIDTDEILIPRRPDCSVLKDGATVFQGVIRNNEINDTKDLFCALRNWWMLQPLVRINDDLQPIDVDCVMLVESSNPKECPIEDEISALLIYGIAGGGGLFILLLVFILANIFWIYIAPMR